MHTANPWSWWKSQTQPKFDDLQGAVIERSKRSHVPPCADVGRRNHKLHGFTQPFKRNMFALFQNISVRIRKMDKVAL